MKTRERSLLLSFALSLFCVLGATGNSSAAEVPKKPERPKLYDPSADGNKQIAAAIKEAKAGQKRIILKFGANW